MSTAAVQIQDAYNKLQASRPPIAEQPMVSEKTNRYLWYPAEDIPHNEASAGFVALMRERAAALGMPNPGITACWIERCRVVPVLAMPCWEEANSVPENLRIKGRNPKPNGDYSEYQYAVPPGFIFQAVMDEYQPWGVTELQALRDGDPGDVLELRIDQTFFPEEKDRSRIGYDGITVDEIPKAYTVQLARIDEVLKKLNGDSRKKTMIDVARDMNRAIEVSRAFDVALVDYEESQKELKYSNHALRALSRLERKRRDHALNEMAQRQNDSLTALPEMIREMARANAPSATSSEDFAAAVSVGVGVAMEKVLEKFGPMFEQLRTPLAPAPQPESPKLPIKK